MPVENVQNPMMGLPFLPLSNEELVTECQTASSTTTQKEFDFLRWINHAGVEMEEENNVYSEIDPDSNSSEEEN